MKLWQHDETGRFTEAPESPGARWHHIPYHCASCEGTGSGGMGVGCTDCLGTGLDPTGFDERAEFEAWIGKIRRGTLSLERDKDGYYLDQSVEARWDAWVVRGLLEQGGWRR